MATSPSKGGPMTSSSVAGSVQCPYKLAIIGGGPSGCSVIVRAMRIGVAGELCGFSYMESTPTKTQTPYLAGVCLIERGTVDRFGGGTLQDYIINSNTHIAKFVTNVVHEKPDNLPPEHAKNTPLERLGSIPSAKELERIGNRTGPLDAVGNFLRDVGQTVMTIIQQYCGSSRCAVGVNVESVQQVADESGSFVCWKIALVRAGSRSASPAPSPTPDLSHVEFVYAKHVVLSTGGHQEIPRLPSSAMNAKVITSDVVCTSDGVEMLKTRIRRNLKAGGSGKVAIIGGSHSAFSAAWICLHKVDESDPRKPAAVSTKPPIEKASKTVPPASPTANGSNPKIIFGSSSICILHRSSVKVFYATKAEADQDSYPDICVNKVTGQINPFGGIRGDAKDLWSRVRAAKEPRVRMLQIRANIGAAQAAEAGFGGVKQSIVDKILEEAAVVIWACGYTTNMMSVLSSTGAAMPIARDKGQVAVDDQARILADDPTADCPAPSPMRGPAKPTPGPNGPTIQNLYGSGLGFGLRATLDNGEPDGASGRADGVAVYLKRGATLVLGHVLGDKVFGGMGIRSWEERNSILRKQAFATRGRSNSDSSDSGTEDLQEASAKTPTSPTRPLLLKSPASAKRSSSSTNPRGRIPDSPSSARSSIDASAPSAAASKSVFGGNPTRSVSTGRALLRSKPESAGRVASSMDSSNLVVPKANRSTTPHSATLRSSVPRGSGSAAIVAQRKASIPSKDHLNLVKRMEAVTLDIGKGPEGKVLVSKAVAATPTGSKR